MLLSQQLHPLSVGHVLRRRFVFIKIVVVIIRPPWRLSSHRWQAGAPVVSRRFGRFPHALGGVQCLEGLVLRLVQVYSADDAVDGLFPVRTVDVINPVGPIFDVFTFCFAPPRTAVVVLLYWRPGRVGPIVFRTLRLLRAQLVVKPLLVVAVPRVQGLVLRGRVSSLKIKFNYLKELL